MILALGTDKAGGQSLRGMLSNIGSLSDAISASTSALSDDVDSVRAQLTSTINTVADLVASNTGPVSNLVNALSNTIVAHAGSLAALDDHTTTLSTQLTNEQNRLNSVSASQTTLSNELHDLEDLTASLVCLCLNVKNKQQTMARKFLSHRHLPYAPRSRWTTTTPT